MARSRYLPLFARAWLIVGPLGLLAIGSQYANRRVEARIYADAPTCPEGRPPQGGCKGKTQAQIVDVDCPDAHQNLDACALKLALGSETRFLYLPREASGRLRAGEQLPIEVFQGLPTGAWLDGSFVPRSGGPETAMRTMSWALGLDIVLLIAAGVYVLAERRKATSS